jgi:hypothetical protein
MKYKVGDLITFRPEFDNGVTRNRYRHLKDIPVNKVFAIESINNSWIRLDGIPDGYSHDLFELYTNPVKLDEDLFTI